MYFSAWFTGRIIAGSEGIMSGLLLAHSVKIQKGSNYTLNKVKALRTLWLKSITLYIVL